MRMYLHVAHAENRLFFGSLGTWPPNGAGLIPLSLACSGNAAVQDVCPSSKRVQLPLLCLAVQGPPVQLLDCSGVLARVLRQLGEHSQPTDHYVHPWGMVILFP